jgi:hypothetical protein
VATAVIAKWEARRSSSESAAPTPQFEQLQSEVQ